MTTCRCSIHPGKAHTTPCRLCERNHPASRSADERSPKGSEDIRRRSEGSAGFPRRSGPSLDGRASGRSGVPSRSVAVASSSRTDG